jgi:FkbM family methyltransferase
MLNQMNSEPKSTIITRKSSLSFMLDYIRVVLYQRLTRSALPVFVRGGDVISASPMVLGAHEPHVAETLKHFASDGYDDFLIDIGANIGLTSSAVGNLFKKVVLFEPNPLCLGVLETNLAINLVGTPYEIRGCGLGSSDEKLTLKIPRTNWGGAHVISKDNSYSVETLLAKDGFNNEDLQNYLFREIDIRNAVDVLKEIFEQFRLEGRLSGSIKIDVEGFEVVVLKSIARALPEEMELSIVFEYWAEQIPFEEVLSAFDGRAQIFGLLKTPRVNGSKWKKFLSLMLVGSQNFSLMPWTSSMHATDFVLRVHKEHSR